MLSDRDRTVLHSALRATVEGPFFPDWEIHALTGLTRDEMRSILAEWPDFADPQAAELAVHNALGNLIGYPHHEWDAWREFSDAPPEELQAVFGRLREVERQGEVAAALRGDDPQAGE